MDRYASPEINRLTPHPLGEWVHWKDHLAALDAERSRLQPLLERCLEAVEDVPLFAQLEAALRAELRKEE